MVDEGRGVMRDPLTGVRELKLGGDIPTGRIINLSSLGFAGRVSDQARAEINANERRAARVLATAHRYWFGRSP